MLLGFCVSNDCEIKDPNRESESSVFQNHHYLSPVRHAQQQAILEARRLVAPWCKMCEISKGGRDKSFRASV